jgi:hypothetical protein
MTPRPSSFPRRALAALVVVAALASAPSAAAMSGGNLVVNGNAEAAIGTEWTVVAGGLQRHAFGQGGYPAAVLVDGTGFGGGTAMFSGAGGFADVRQTIALTVGDREAIATGTVRARFSAQLGGYATQRDQLGAEATWLDAAGDVVLTQTLAPVTRDDRGGVSAFLRREDLQAVPPTATSVTVRLSGTREVAPAHDGYADNVTLQLIGIPAVAVTAPSRAVAGRPTPVTWTIANSEDLEAKPGWAFRATLPEGVTLASSRPVLTTCEGARVSADRTALSVAGALPAGAPTCTVTAEVVAPEGRYAFTPDDVRGAEGLRPPAGSTELVVRAAEGPGTPGSPAGPLAPVPPSAPTVLPGPLLPPGPPSASPPGPAPVVVPGPTPAGLPRADDALVLQALAPASRLRVGRRTTVTVRVRNRTAGALTDVDVCARLPRGLLYLPTRSGAAPVDGRRCWTVRRLPAGAARTLRLSAKAVRGGRATVRLTAGAAEAAGTATTDRTTRVTR